MKEERNTTNQTLNADSARAENIEIEYRGRRFSISQQTLEKYRLNANRKPEGKQPVNGRWYELGESDCY